MDHLALLLYPNFLQKSLKSQEIYQNRAMQEGPQNQQLLFILAEDAF
jgi:hypothetical protein